MTVKGYEVRKRHEGYHHIAGKDLDHVAYLDHFKNPLNRLVWATKERK
jgi:hypothetical protein